MLKIDYLRAQAARADRLARAMMDNLTIGRLQAMSREYQQQADQLAGYFGPRNEQSPTPHAERLN
jgi:hypothetical protein